jgi:hypothetical protein
VDNTPVDFQMAELKCTPVGAHRLKLFRAAERRDACSIDELVRWEDTNGYQRKTVLPTWGGGLGAANRLKLLEIGRPPAIGAAFWLYPAVGPLRRLLFPLHSES